MATPSYKERMKAARAEARAKREAEKAAWHRRAELIHEVRHIAREAVIADIRARSDRVSLYKPREITAQANALIGCIFEIFVFIALAMLATVSDMGR